MVSDDKLVNVERCRFRQKYSMVVGKLCIRDKIPMNNGLLMWWRHLLGEMAPFELPRSVVDWGRLVMARAGVRFCIR
jgi:hypothetical protein